MVTYLRGRFVDSIVTLVLASIVAFAVMHLLPGDPARLIAGPLASAATLAAVKDRLGLSHPLYQQYGDFISGFVRGDWGYSYSLGSPVRTLLSQRIPATLELAIWAFVFAIVLALLVATIASYRKGFAGALAKLFSLIGLGTPPFWFGLVLLVVLSNSLHLFPGPTGRLTSSLKPPPDITGMYTFDALFTGHMVVFSDALAHLILPAVTLAFLPWAFLTRLLTANMADVADQPYVLVVRSKGVTALRTHVKHVLANSLLPTVSSSGLVFAQLITGSVLVESVFNWPGIGLLLTKGISNQDFALVQTFILLSAILYVVVNFAVDILNGFVDPRVRAGAGRRSS